MSDEIEVEKDVPFPKPVKRGPKRRFDFSVLKAHGDSVLIPYPPGLTDKQQQAFSRGVSGRASHAARLMNCKVVTQRNNKGVRVWRKELVRAEEHAPISFYFPDAYYNDQRSGSGMVVIEVPCTLDEINSMMTKLENARKDLVK